MLNPSAGRNRDAIHQLLLKHIPRTFQGTFLEIASGTGMHLEIIAPSFPLIQFQPSDVDQRSIESIREVARECSTKNICQPLFIDIKQPFSKWGKCSSSEGPYLLGDQHKDFSELEGSFDFMLNINMIHISEFACTEGLFSNAGRLLKKNGKLFTYGPYADKGILKPDSNVNFDKSLRAQNPEWGVRDIVQLMEVGEKYGMLLVENNEMPANNKFLVWQKI